MASIEELETMKITYVPSFPPAVWNVNKTTLNDCHRTKNILQYGNLLGKLKIKLTPIEHS